MRTNSTSEREQKIEEDVEKLRAEGLNVFSRREGEDGPLFLILSQRAGDFHIEDEFVSWVCNEGYEASYVDYKKRETAFKPTSAHTSSESSSESSTTATDYRDGLSRRLIELDSKGPIYRLEELADIAYEVVQERGLYDPDEIRAFCDDFGAREVVGCTVGAMPMHKVLRHLSEYAFVIDSFDPPEFGGSEDVEEQLTLPHGGMGFTHYVYWALQEFYSDAIFAVVIMRMEIFDEDVVLDSPVGKLIRDEVYGVI